ncbi:hypothetical protein FKM82_020147 [Ascaphus truei]
MKWFYTLNAVQPDDGSYTLANVINQRETNDKCLGYAKVGSSIDMECIAVSQQGIQGRKHIRMTPQCQS